MTVGMTLLKIKLLLDFTDLQSCWAEHSSKVPREVLFGILSKIPQSPVLQSKEIYEKQDHERQIAELKRQIRSLYLLAEKHNNAVWTGLITLDRIDLPWPSHFSRASQEEADLAVKYSYKAFQEISRSHSILLALQAGEF